FFQDPAFGIKIHFLKGLSQAFKINKPPAHPLAVMVEFLSEFISQKILFGKNNCLVNEKKKWNKNTDINQRIGQNTHTHQHQDISYIKWIAAMVKNPFRHQTICIHLFILPPPYYIGKAD